MVHEMMVEWYFVGDSSILRLRRITRNDSGTGGSAFEGIALIRIMVQAIVDLFYPIEKPSARSPVTPAKLHLDSQDRNLFAIYKKVCNNVVVLDSILERVHRPSAGFWQTVRESYELSLREEPEEFLKVKHSALGCLRQAIRAMAFAR